jgi:hypothetical protein
VIVSFNGTPVSARSIEEFGAALDLFDREQRFELWVSRCGARFSMETMFLPRRGLVQQTVAADRDTSARALNCSVNG